MKKSEKELKLKTHYKAIASVLSIVLMMKSLEIKSTLAINKLSKTKLVKQKAGSQAINKQIQLIMKQNKKNLKISSTLL